MAKAPKPLKVRPPEPPPAAVAATAKAEKAYNKAALQQTARLVQLTFVDPTEKPAAVARAIGLQLVRDRHWPPPNLNKKMDANYNYDRISMGNFLLAVRATLRAGNPSHTFEFDDAFVIKVLPMTVSALGAQINAKTSRL